MICTNTLPSVNLVEFPGTGKPTRSWHVVAPRSIKLSSPTGLAPHVCVERETVEILTQILMKNLKRKQGEKRNTASFLSGIILSF